VSITGLARLVAEGELDLDTPISAYSKNLPHEEWHAFTARQLASHTAGLGAYQENNDWVGLYRSMALRTRFNDPKDALSAFDGADTLFPPQTDFHYSGFGNVLLSAVMQDAAREPFDTLMSSRVFEPLGLTSTKPDHLRTKETEFARSYQTKGAQIKPWRRVDLSHKLAAGGYISTPSELALLGTAWLDPEFIPPSLRDDFWTPVALSNGEINEQNYALGFRQRSGSINGADQTVFFSHGGVSKGTQSWFMIVPEHRLSLAISTNRRTDQFFDFANVYVDLLETFVPNDSTDE
jgi:CubicO group peptidase (beta-lactamase class C family)